MNTFKILVPTDFSDAGNNAADYAMRLAADMNASVLLFHAFHVPVPTAEMPIMVISPGELQKDNLQRLDHLRSKLLKKHGYIVHVECKTNPGFAGEEIADAAKANRASLVVMGISGSGKLIHALLGSVPTNIIQDLKVPMLVIPEKAGYKKPSKLIFACDYSDHIAQKALVELRAFVKPLDAQVFIVDIKTPAGDPDQHVINESALVEDTLKDVQHSVHALVNKDVIAGLLAFQEKHRADMIVMIPHKHSLLDRIFNTPHTREMVFKSEIPVLALKE